MNKRLTIILVILAIAAILFVTGPGFDGAWLCLFAFAAMVDWTKGRPASEFDSDMLM